MIDVYVGTAAELPLRPAGTSPYKGEDSELEFGCPLYERGLGGVFAFAVHDKTDKNLIFDYGLL
jgi:hypothetical protein